MNQFDHRLCNADLHPADGDEETVGVLRVQQGRFPGTDIIVTRSFWKPTPEELSHLLGGGLICLSVFGRTHAPLRLDVVPE